MKLTQLATGLLLAGLMTGSALAADKIFIAHRGASAICQSIRCRQKRWPMRRGRITWSRIW